MLDFDALVLGPAMAAFGEPVSYAPGHAAPFTVQAVFDEAYAEVKFEGDAPIATTRPMLGVQASAFPGLPPCAGELFTVRGQVWHVAEVHPDGRGHLKIYLMKTRAR